MINVIDVLIQSPYKRAAKLIQKHHFLAKSGVFFIPQWVPEKYKSMMNLAYKDDNGKIVMPYLDQGAVEFSNNQPTYCYVG